VDHSSGAGGSLQELIHARLWLMRLACEPYGIKQRAAGDRSKN